MKTLALFLVLSVSSFGSVITLRNGLTERLYVESAAFNGHIPSGASVVFFVDEEMDFGFSYAETDTGQVYWGDVVPTSPGARHGLSIDVGGISGTQLAVTYNSYTIPPSIAFDFAAAVYAFLAGFFTVFPYGVWRAIKGIFREAE